LVEALILEEFFLEGFLWTSPFLFLKSFFREEDRVLESLKLEEENLDTLIESKPLVLQLDTREFRS